MDVADNSIAFAGLFGYVKNGQIKNLGLLDSQISATASNGDDSSAYAGGIAGRLVDDSLIAGCYNTDAVTATAFSDHCPSSYAGGIAGLVENDSIVTNCYNTGAVTANASSTADFITTASAGGIGGYVFDGTITTCYNTGEVKAKASAKYSYYARAYLGGIAGMISYSGSTEKCYYLDNVSAGVGFGSGDATRCTWQEMTQQENFSGFDFETVWTMAGNENYLLPELRAVEMAKTTYLTSIELLTKPDKLEYQEGEDALDVTGGEIKLVYNNGMTLVVDLEAHMVTGFDNTVVGEQTLTVSYGGKETSYQITIVPVSQPEEEIPTTVYDGVDYAAVYDYDYYHSHYPDLQDAFGDNDVAFLEHFVLCGMAEGRQAQ